MNKTIYINNEQELFDAFDDKCLQRAQDGDLLIINKNIVLHKDLCIDRKVGIKAQGEGRMLYTNGYSVSATAQDLEMKYN